MPVAINLSAKSIGDPRLLEEIREAFRDPRTARRVTFEITETAAAQNIAHAQVLVRALTELGCGVALDDFGTGYGSFTYLKHLPVTELKIDIEFVRGLVHDTANQRIVRSLVDVASNFGMRTVAEGVEDEATLTLLKELCVDLVQGYHLGRPAPLGNTEVSRSTTPQKSFEPSSPRSIPATSRVR
jgi:EAL domain-containing protein (putative c-di-GMP-specific phosphodiesterase class I)